MWASLNPVLGGVGSYMHFQYCLWTCSIELRLQTFPICIVRLLWKFSFFILTYHLNRQYRCLSALMYLQHFSYTTRFSNACENITYTHNIKIQWFYLNNFNRLNEMKIIVDLLTHQYCKNWTYFILSAGRQAGIRLWLEKKINAVTRLFVSLLEAPIPMLTTYSIITSVLRCQPHAHVIVK